MRPKKVEIMGQVLSVEYRDGPLIVGEEAEQKVGAGAVGYSNITAGELVVAEGQSFYSERDTLLHEAMHGLMELTGLALFRAEKQTEDVVTRLASPLLAMLRSNPDLVQYLTETPLEPDECKHHLFGPNCEECGSE